MADTKLTALTANTAPVDTDITYMVDDPAGTPLSQKIAMSDLLRLGDGQVSVTGGVASQALAASTWTKITQFTAEYSGTGATASHANDKITVTNAGLYLLTAQVSFNGTASSTVDLAIYWNGAAQAQCQVKLNGSNEVQSASIIALVNVATGATDVELWARTSGAHNVDLKEAQLIAHRVA